MQWFKSYPGGRMQVTEIDGIQSNQIPMQLGVPLDSILGPILFLIYVKGINNCNNDCEFTKFADNTTVLTTGSNLEEAVANMNKVMVDIDLWFKRNKLNLIPSKTSYMILNHKTDSTKFVKIGDEYLERVWKCGNETSFKPVRIWVDEDLSWSDHIDKLCWKINSAIYGLNKSRRSLNANSRKLIDSGLIHSHLVYGLPIWGFAKQNKLKLLKTQQKLAIQKVYNLKARDHTHKYFQHARILKFDDLFEHTTMCYIQSGLHHTSPYHVKKLFSV